MHPHILYKTDMGGVGLSEQMDRIYREAHYIIEHGATVRETSNVFQTGKSTVHQDVTKKLCTQNAALAQAVRKVLDKNKAERHIRGGQATMRKYRKDVT